MTRSRSNWESRFSSATCSATLLACSYLFTSRQICSWLTSGGRMLLGPKPPSLVSMDDEAAARPTLNRLMRKDDCADCARASKAWTVDFEPTPRQRNKAKHGSSASERRIYISRVEEETLRRVNRHEVCHFEQARCRNTIGRPSRWHRGNPKWVRGSPAEEPR